MRATRVVVAVLLVGGACRPGDRADPAAATTSPRAVAVAAPSTPPVTQPVPAGGTSGPDIVTLLVTNVRLTDSQAADNGFRVVVDSAAGAVSVVLSGIPTPNRAIFVCPAAALEQPANRSTCTNPADGQPTRLPFGPASRGVEVVQFGATGLGPDSTPTTVRTIAVTFTPMSREVALRLPPLRPGATGGSASFRLSPPGTTGDYRAVATWATPASAAPGRAMLSLLGVDSATNAAEGGPGVTLAGTLTAPADATIRLRNAGDATLTGVTVTALLP